MVSRRSFLVTLVLATLGLALSSPGEEDPGPGVKAMLEAIDDYQKWLKRGDYIKVNKAWLVAVNRWEALDGIGRRQVERLRPGTRQWMETGDGYEPGMLSDPP